MRFLTILLLTTVAAGASTPGAWDALDTAARKACEREIVHIASKAKVSKVVGRVSGIGPVSDGDHYYGLLLSGKTAGYASQWMCLYDKRAKSAVAREIETR